MLLASQLISVLIHRLSFLSFIELTGFLPPSGWGISKGYVIFFFLLLEKCIKNYPVAVVFCFFFFIWCLSNRLACPPSLRNFVSLLELEEESPVINWSLELGTRLDSRLYALWNRTAGDCLLDSVLQATWGIYDKDSVLRKTLHDSLHDCSHWWGFAIV